MRFIYLVLPLLLISCNSEKAETPEKAAKAICDCYAEAFAKEKQEEFKASFATCTDQEKSARKAHKSEKTSQGEEADTPFGKSFSKCLEPLQEMMAKRFAKDMEKGNAPNSNRFDDVKLDEETKSK